MPTDGDAGDKDIGDDRDDGATPLGLHGLHPGARVGITTNDDDDPPLAARLRNAGFAVVAVPCARAVPLSADEARALAAFLDRLAAVDAVVCTSRHAAAWFAQQRQHREGHQAPAPLMAAVGPTTAAVLTEKGIAVDVVGDAGAAGLAARILPLLRPGSRVAHPHGRRVLPDLADALRAAGHTVDGAVCYAFDDVSVDLDAVVGTPPFEALVITSPRRADAVASLLGMRDDARPALFAIGTTTAARLKALGLPCGVVDLVDPKTPG